MFFGKQPFQLIEIPKFGKGTILTADAVISENYNKSASVTTYPVESGNDIAEHAMVSSFTISINGINSDASMSYFDLLENVASSAIGQLFGGASKSQGVWTLLNRWLDTGVKLQVKCIYEKEGFKDSGGAIIPFVLESLGVSRNKDVGAAIRYNITLRQISLVQIGAASFVDLKLGVFDKGAQQLQGGPTGDAAGAQPNAVRLHEKLVTNVPAQDRILRLLPGAP